MNANFERSGIYPLSTEPAEGYGVDPTTRSGEVIISHINGKFIIATNDGGYDLSSNRGDATRFPDHSVASLKAAQLIKRVQEKLAA